jgi:hypothetical protein
MQDDDVKPVEETKTEIQPKHEIHTHFTRFQVGELLPWKGLWFEVIEVTIDGLVLKTRKSIEKKHG